MTQTWFFELKTDPLTDRQVEALDNSRTNGAVSLSPHGNGTIACAVEADTIHIACALARSDVSDITGRRPPRITALHGQLADSVADVVFRAAENLRIDAAEILLEHLALVWYREACKMAACGAFDEQYFDGHGNPKRAFVVKPTPDNEMVPTEVMMTWDAIYAAAKGYLNGRPVVGSEARVLADSGSGS